MAFQSPNFHSTHRLHTFANTFQKEAGIARGKYFGIKTLYIFSFFFLSWVLSTYFLSSIQKRNGDRRPVQAEARTKDWVIICLKIVFLQFSSDFLVLAPE